ncbi:hypothetical protein ENSA7_45830 [Enhygromyxa salina]|uniref:Heparin-sulfate lyase N-terminal domain-containing protein n=1 Tax=Enhygromyxa salina TaxID=215803 RepID=A0A2S9YKB8_9BACT|nr:hypothetical protein ENSA7_45830 [Enhygromyxa salina]
METLANPEGWATLLGALYVDPDDPVALEQAVDTVCLGNDQSVPSGTYALGLYWEHFSEAQRQEMKDCMKSWHEINGHGTENHALMKNFAGFLFTQWFPEEDDWLTNQGPLVSGDELHESIKANLLQVMSSLYDKGYTENLSTTYDMLHLFPLLGLYAFADDDEIVRAAEAALLFHYANLAMNTFHGITLPPYNRSNYQQVNANYHGVQPNVQFMNWMYWPEGTNITDDVETWRSHSHNSTVVYNASIEWCPPDVIRKVATGNTTSYTGHGSFARFGAWGDGPSHDNMRTVYRTGDYAVGTGFLRYQPGGFYVNFKNFMLAYASSDTYNYIESSHNYWGSALSEAAAWRGASNSPFHEIAHHENTVISLFNIPELDPWEGLGSWADQRLQAPIQRADTRYPKSVDEVVESEGWIFMREGEVYVGIRPLRDYVIDTETTDELAEFNMIRSEGATNAIVYELGTVAQHGSFEGFQAQLQSNPLEIDWEALSVSYTDSDGDVLRATWVAPDYVYDSDVVAVVRPEIEINDVIQPEFDPELWPVLEGPYVSLVDRVLTVHQGGRTLTVDWSGEMPVVTEED